MAVLVHMLCNSYSAFEDCTRFICTDIHTVLRHLLIDGACPVE